MVWTSVHSTLGACSPKKFLKFRPYESASEAVGDHHNYGLWSLPIKVCGGWGYATLSAGQVLLTSLILSLSTVERSRRSYKDSDDVIYHEKFLVVSFACKHRANSE